LKRQGSLMQAAVFNLDHPARYFSFGPISISAGNATIILVMIVLFGIALFLPFPHGKGDKK
jgi:hypothetical protein